MGCAPQSEGEPIEESGAIREPAVTDSRENYNPYDPSDLNVWPEDIQAPWR